MIKIIAKKEDFVLKVLSAQRGVSFNTLSKALRKKDIKINGKRVTENIKVKPGDEIIAYVDDKILKPDIIFEDENLAIFNKPANIEVTGEGSLEALLQTENKNLQACHRLDRNTGGLVIFSKNINSHEELLEAFKKGYIIKHYTAWVKGILKLKQATLTAFLFKDAKNSQVFIYDKKTTGSKQIKTIYKVIKEIGGNSILDVQILTGRTHQIRAHLSFIGHPIIGDDKYGSTKINKHYGLKKQCLTASGISFNFPKGSILEYLNGKNFKISPNFDAIIR